MKIITSRTTLLLGVIFFIFVQTTSFAQWVEQNTPPMKGLYEMHAIGKNVMWTDNVNLGGLDTAHIPQFIRTGDAGKTYKIGRLLNADFSSLFPYDAKTAYLIGGNLAGDNYFLRRTVDSGVTWQDLPYRPTTFPDFINFYDANNGIFLGDPDSLGYNVAYTNDGGNTFTRVPQTNLPRLIETEYATNKNAQIIGNTIFITKVDYSNGNWGILRSTDRGRNWTSGDWIAEDFFELRYAFTDANNGMALRGIGANSRNPIYTTDGGATWHESSSLPGPTGFPIANIPNTQSLMAFFEDTVSGVLFTALTNDLGKTWNTRKDVEPYELDSRYVELFGVNPYINGQLEIVDNHTAWAQFTNTAIHRYDSEIPIVPLRPDLDLELTADNDGLPLYGSVKYTLTVKNRGISPASGVKINWLPPYKRTNNGAGAYAYQSAYSSTGWYDSWNGVWSIDQLEAGASATATFHLFVVDNTKDVTHTAQVIACNENDLDSSPNNMSDAAKEDDEVGYVSQANNVGTIRFEPHKEKMIEFAISPNPAIDNLTIAIHPATEKEWSVRVLNSIGQTVISQNGQSYQLLDVDVKRLTAGLYIVEYQSDGERKIEKLLVQH